MSELNNPNDLDNDGHDDANGQFVEGNTEAANPAPEAPVVEQTPEVEIEDVELNLIATAEAFLAACVAFAEVPETPQFYRGEGYRLQFVGHSLSVLTVG